MRELVGSRSLSATVDDAIGAHLIQLRHRAAVRDWLQEMDHAHGPVPAESLEWAAQVVQAWVAEHEIISPLAPEAN